MNGLRSVGSPRTSADRFPLVPFDKIKLSTAIRWRVKGLLPLTGLALFWGPPKCGKSFLVFDLLMHVALGRDYRGRRVLPGSVVYAALEGQQGFEARAAAFRQEHMAEAADPVPFYLMPAALNLVQDHAALIAAIRMQMPEGERPAAVCLDTLNRSFVGSESDDQAMTAYVRAADAIRDAFGCLVVIVHHCGIDGARPRGHSSLAGAIDTQIAVRKAGDKEIIASVDLMKDGPEGDTFASRLKVVEVATDDDGDPITSCVLEEVERDALEQPRETSGGRRLSDRHRLALNALAETVLSFGKPPPPGWQLPDGIKTVPEERWREEMHSRGVIEADDKNPRATFKRIREALAARSLIGNRDGSVWQGSRP